MEGGTRECTGDHEVICGLFPHLGGCAGGEAALKLVHLEGAATEGPGDEPPGEPLRLGVVLSGGQAPGASRGPVAAGSRVCMARCPPASSCPITLRAPRHPPHHPPPSPPPPTITHTLTHTGGHNVIIGLHDYLQRWHPGSTLVGFLNGPRGVMQNKYKVLTADELVRAALRLHAEASACREQAESLHKHSMQREPAASFAAATRCPQDGYRNQGGFHLICSGRDKIERADQLAAAAEVSSAPLCRHTTPLSHSLATPDTPWPAPRLPFSQTCAIHDLDGIIIIGGDDSNTNAAVMAEHFLKQGVKTNVIGVPKTIDGGLAGAGTAHGPPA